MDFEPRVSACSTCFAGGQQVTVLFVFPCRVGFACAVAETSGTEFSDIDLLQKVRRKPIVSVPDPKPTPAQIASSFQYRFPARYTASDARAG